MPMQPQIDPADHPSAKIDGPATRVEPAKWLFVCDPTNTVSVLNAANVRDWERRGKGWAVIGPARGPSDVWNADCAPAVVEAPVEEVIEVKPPVPSSTPEERLAVDNLSALRAEAEALGVEVDQRWGLKRLTAVIAEAKETAQS